EEAGRIVADATEQARETRLEAEDYVDAKLAQFEITLQRLQESLEKTQEALAESVDRIQQALSRTAEQVTSGRAKLRGPDSACCIRSTDSASASWVFTSD